MNYRHAYHAGNFADVFKHSILILLLQALQRKPKDYCYLDTHAGSGYYKLDSEAARKTGEFQQGIMRVWRKTDAPAGLRELLELVGEMNHGFSQPRQYPGSSWLAARIMRPHDRLVLLELEDMALEALKHFHASDHRVHVHGRDAMEGLKALLPPVEKRGLVLIDSPFEQPGEFELIADGLAEANRRWATGMYAAWYPIKQRGVVNQFLKRLQDDGYAKLLYAELQLYPGDNPQWLHGCGMALINPPWHLPEQLNLLLPWLAREMAQSRQPGSWKVEWLRQS
jgi:23S rRNA (adenine2030-N6)-methyltransferase